MTSESIAADKAKVKQPEWLEPSPAGPDAEPVLRVYNSMTKTKNAFTPMKGKSVKWYNCGPTVYDASHLGHARNYVTQDILRRILSDYFGYDVHLVMNITDIDDKIIQRARYTYLVNRLRDDSSTLSQSLLTSVKDAFVSYLTKKLSRSLPVDAQLKGTDAEILAAWPALYDRSRTDAAFLKAAAERDEKFSMHITALNSAYIGLTTAEKSLSLSLSPNEPTTTTTTTTTTTSTQAQAQANVSSLIESSRDILGPHLDDQHKSSVTDHAIFRSLTTYWEDAFMNDMAKLRVLPPDTLTRVTEYVPEIVGYVDKIVGNGYAYATEDGSVYFDTRAFDGRRRRIGGGGVGVGLSDGGEDEWTHAYAKLMPWNKGNMELLEEGEGALTSSSGKRAAADFALWKASKPGEPAWPSPWGPGRPGWHIECSVMATEILGDNMDIHSGGIDLAFPHHDNEIAQAEAYHDCRQWVNYFLHTGHLHIEGLKMSKSLKNFITIEEALSKYSARQLRLVFLGQLWNAKMDFRESAISEAKSIETTMDNFFANAKALIAEGSTTSRPQDDTHHHFDQPEHDLTTVLHQAQRAFRTALCDSFNTPEALAILVDVISKANVYISTRGRGNVNVGVLGNVARWVTRMVRMFGLGEGVVAAPVSVIGWGTSSAVGAGEDAGAFDREAVLMPYLRALSTFRDEVRKLAIGQAPSKDILALCDKLRDVDLAPLGVALDDQEDGKALVKLVDPAALLKAREEKEAALAEKAAKKAAAVEAEKARRLAKLEKGKVPPNEMFKPPNVPGGMYGSWNEDGIPLTDGSGAELSKKGSKKVQKDWEIQSGLHKEWLVYLESEAQKKE